jgi:hypothetical protein
MKPGDLVITRGETTPGVLLKIIDSNIFGGDAIVSVLWATQTKTLKTLRSSLRKANV